jgi:hypothetical protein
MCMDGSEANVRPQALAAVMDLQGVHNVFAGVREII